MISPKSQKSQKSSKRNGKSKHNCFQLIQKLKQQLINHSQSQMQLQLQNNAILHQIQAMQQEQLIWSKKLKQITMKNEKLKTKINQKQSTRQAFQRTKQKKGSLNCPNNTEQSVFLQKRRRLSNACQQHEIVIRIVNELAGNRHRKSLADAYNF